MNLGNFFGNAGWAFNALLRFATICFAICLYAASANAQKVGALLPIDESQVLSSQIPALKQQLVRLSVGSSSHGLVSLVPCDAKHFSVEKQAVIGACGREVTLPQEWKLDASSELARGAAFGKTRPSAKKRQAMLQENFVKPSPRLNHLYEEIPSDVIAMRVDRDTWRVGFDWDCDLRIANDETVLVKDTALPGQPGWIKRERELIAVVTRGRNRAAAIASKTWTIGYRTMALDGYQPSWKYKSKLPQQLLELATDESARPIAMIDFSGGAAELASAVDAAKRAECDRLIVDLGKCRMRPTDATRLLAKLSLEHGLPILATRKTPASPDYLVIPGRSDLPDLLQLAFPAKQDAMPGFELALKEFLQPALAKDELDSKTQAAETPSDWNQFRKLFSGIGTERFAPVPGTQYVAVRVPDDAIDGKVVMKQSPDIGFPESHSLTLYDRNGKRITGDKHGNNVSYDRVPSLDVLFSRGGYLVADKQLRWHGAEHDMTQEGYRAVWIRGSSPVIDLPHETRFCTIEINSAKPLPAQLHLSKQFELAKLTRYDENLVPDAILSATKHLRDARLGVRSWWYRGAPRYGSIDYRPLFQHAGKQLPVWDDQHLQYWTVLDSGYLQPGSFMMGDLGCSTPQRAWFLVQTAVTADTKDNPAPEIVQLIGGFRSWAGRIDRVSQEHQEPIAGEDETKTWISQYRYGVNAAAKDIDIRWSGVHVPAGNLWSPKLAWISDSQPYHQSRPRDWNHYYDDDPAQDELQRQLASGVSADDLLEFTMQPDPQSKSIPNWRRYLLALDQPSIRKQHLDLVADVSQRVVTLCNQELGGLPKPLSPYVDDFRVPMPEDVRGQIHYAWAVDASYRKARAIGYRELPDVIEKHPIGDPVEQKKVFLTAIQQLNGLTRLEDPRFVLPLIRWERRNGNFAKAYELLLWVAYEGPAMKWYFKKQRDLFNDFGIEPLSRLGNARWHQRQNGLPVSH